MSSYAGGMSGGSDTDTVTRRLREAERARADAERAHADALAQLRASQRSSHDPHAVEQLQSRVRELEKKAALETVRCEELQLELSSALRARGVTTTWSTHSAQPASEIERIMAKIEQDNRILAELEHTRSTTHGIQTSGSNQGLGEFHSPTPSPLPYSYTGSGHAAICQSNTMPTLSALHSTGQFTAPSSNSVSYAISAHNPTSYSNPVSAYSTNSYGLSNTHQVTFTNPVTAPLVNSIGQISSTLTGLQSNLQNITGNVSGMNIGSGLGTGTGISGTLTGSALTSCLNNPPTSLSGGLTSTLGGIQTSLTGALGNALSSLTGASQLGNLNTNLSSTSAYGTATGTYTNPLLSTGLGTNAMNIKLKPLDEIDLIGRYANNTTMVGRVATPVTPHQPTWNLGLDSQFGTDRLGGMDSGFSHDRNQRALARTIPNSGLDLDVSVRNPQFVNGADPTVDMLDIPGKGRCCIFVTRYPYESSEIDNAEGNLSVGAGEYLITWGTPDPNSTVLEAETLEGQHGFIPASYVQRLVGEDLLDFHQSIIASMSGVDESATTAISDLSLTTRDVARLSEMADIAEGPEDDDNVPAPRQLTLERQLNKSVLIGWTAPEGYQQANIESYHVYVDGVLKTTVKASERTRALVEGVDSHRPHRISVRSVTVTRRTSRDAACTMVIGRDTANMGPTCVRASGVTCSQAVISWLPANSNHQHVVCVNNVEVRTVKPGVYRHTITGLSPSTQYRVTVRAKHLRAGPPGVPIEEAPGAYTDFRTLPKGLPDPPNEIMVEAGPQDGTLLVTWQPVVRPPASGPVTGYAVYADGKKVTDVDSPTGDHALIDIAKLIGLNPKCVTVRTKSRDSQSSDSAPTAIPPTVLRGVMSRMPRGAPMPGPNQPQPGPFSRQQRPQPYQQQQQVIEHDENLSDKEIFPSNNRHDPHAAAQQPSQPVPASQPLSGQQHPSTPGYHGTQQPPYPAPGHFPSSQPTQYPGQSQNQYQQQPQQQQQSYNNPPPPRNHHERGRPPNPHQSQQGQPGSTMPYGPRPGGPVGPRGPQPGARHQQGGQQSKRCRYFIALFDYDPSTMSPNPESCDEELPFSEGDAIKVWGDKDADGFYWGESRGRRGYVPHNMVMEISEQEATQSGAKPRDRWTDAYNNQPVRRMVAMYDYDPQELSPNVDADAELSFQTGQIIHVYGEMDDDGFYMAEIDGVRGLVPSNFLTDASDQYPVQGQASQVGVRGANPGSATAGRGRGAPGAPGSGAPPPGPGARGPPPPPRDNVAPAPRNHHRKTDACPLPPSQLDHNTCASNPEQAISQARARGAAIGQPASTIARTSAGNASTPPGAVQSPGSAGMGAGAGGAVGAGVTTPQQTSAPSPARRAGPAVVPAPTAQPLAAAATAAQVPATTQPNLMQKFTEMTAPGGDILSKGKELIFMKFGLGGK